MFNIEKHCLSEPPTDDDYIYVCLYSMWSTPPLINGPLFPDMDPMTGALVLKNQTGIVKCVLSKLYENYSALQEFFHLALLHDGLIKFCARYINGPQIYIYLYKPLFTEPVYIPRTFNIAQPKLPELTAADARNEQIDEDYNGMFQHDLHNYQQNNVAWMIGIEELTAAKCNFIEYPQIRELRLHRAVYGNDTLLYNHNTRFLYPASYEETVPNHIHQLQGGVLADEVGLGKTFSMYGLIINTLSREISFWGRKPTKRMLAAESEDWEEIPGPLDHNDNPLARFTSHATLIIGPTRLTGQWADELEKFMVPLHDLRVYSITSIPMFRKLTAAELCNADIIIISDRFLINTNYQIYINDTEFPERFGLHDFYWKRLVIDEGHEILASDYQTISLPIRNQLYGLKSRYRWLCTGTPFPREYESFDHYLYFLSGFTYNLEDYTFFDAATINSFIQQNTHRNTYQNIKNQIHIPPITQTTVLLSQDPVERALYVNATGEITRMIQLCTNILVSGVDSSIIDDTVTSLQDVRQRMCDYYQSEVDGCQRQIEMAKTEHDRAEELYEDAGDVYEIDSNEYRDYRAAQRTAMRGWNKKIKEYKTTAESMEARKKLFDNLEQRVERDPCVICYGEMTDVVLTKCSHIFCRGCMKRVIDDNPHNVICPMCRTQLNRSTDIGYIIEQVNVTDDDSQYYHHVQKWGTKMAWLVQYLDEVMNDPSCRVIIFSQWKEMLKLVGSVLDEVDIKQVYLRGSASQLSKYIRQFKTSPVIRTIMLSSETCSSGSNLTEASHIVLLDTVNGTASQAKAIEDQAIGRAARLGQTKNVQVVRLIMNNTVEYDYYKENINQTGVTEVHGGEDINI